MLGVSRTIKQSRARRKRANKVNKMIQKRENFWQSEEEQTQTIGVCGGGEGCENVGHTGEACVGLWDKIRSYRVVLREMVGAGECQRWCPPSSLISSPSFFHSKNSTSVTRSVQITTFLTRPRRMNDVCAAQYHYLFMLALGRPLNSPRINCYKNNLMYFRLLRQMEKHEVELLSVTRAFGR